MTAIVNEQQNILDVVVQNCGAATDLFAVAKANDMSMTDERLPGDEVEVDEVMMSRKDIANYLAAKKAIPASKYDRNLENEGIGFWQIGIDFTVQ